MTKINDGGPAFPGTFDQPAGMTFDRRIPEEARAVLAEKAVQIDAITEANLDEGSMGDD